MKRTTTVRAATEDKLTDADWAQVFKKNPTEFIEALVLNVIYASEQGSKERDAIIARQVCIFNKWLGCYDTTYRETIARSVQNSLQAKYNAALHEQISRAELRGRMAALTNLPLKKTLLSKVVDFDAVTKEIQRLKGATIPNATSATNQEAA